MRFAVFIVVMLVLVSYYVYAYSSVFQPLPTGLVIDRSHPRPEKLPETYKITYIRDSKGNAIARIKNNELQYLHRDYLGSLRLITDKNGNIISKMDYIWFV